MNNICPEHNIQKIISFLLSQPTSLSSCQIGCHFCDRCLLNKVCFLTPSIYAIAKRNNSLKNPRKNNVCNNLSISCRLLNTCASSNSLPSIKYISIRIVFNIIYLIRQSPQFTIAPRLKTSPILRTPSPSSTPFY